jgi:peptide/nickel transport system substrate-binding protein
MLLPIASSLSRRRFLSLAAAGTGTALVAACGRPSAGTTGAGSSSSPRRGGTLVLGFESDIGPMDIELSHGAVNTRVRMMMYDSLVERDYTNQHDVPPQIPGLAESWTVAPDGMSYTFNLRKGVTFHDGTPFNADAAKFDIDRDFDPSHPYYWKTGAGAIKNILGRVRNTEVVDDYTLRVNMKELEVNFLDLMEGFNFPSPASIKKYGIEGYAQHPVGTGPFKFTKYDEGVQAELERNPDWWGKDQAGGGPFVDKLVVRFLPEPTTRVAALLAGQVDWIAAVPADSVGTIQENKKYYVALDPPAPHTWIWRTNFKNPLTARKEVRQAIALGIDRERMARDLLRNTAAPAYQFWAPGNVAYRPTPKDMTYGYDPERAKKLLAQAGYPNGIDILAYVPTSGSGMMEPVSMNQFIQDNLSKVGIRVKYESVEWQTYLSRSQAGFPAEYAIFNSSLSGGSPSTLYRYFHSSMQPPNGGDPGWYVSRDVDKLLDQAGATLDQDKRYELYEQVNDLITEDVVFVNVVHDKVPLAWSKTVHGFNKVPSWNISFTQTWIEG